MKMETVFYRLTTKSSLIVSPRSALAFYKDLDEFSDLQIMESAYLMENKLKVIYPFYQYGMYAAYKPDKAAYYLPGSSIKGALRQGGNDDSKLMVDDILIPNKDIALRNIYKIQYLGDIEKARYGPFFDHVGVEMIPAEVVLEGQFNVSDSCSAKKLLEEANKSTKERMKQMESYLNRLPTEEYPDKLREKIDEAVTNTCLLSGNEHMFLLGGYKGLLHSMMVKEPLEEINSGIFLDPETMLPHGIVEIELQ